MNKHYFVPLVALALAVAAACEPELTLTEALQGKQCRAAEPPCVAGYECNSLRVCVPLASGGGGGSAALPSANGGSPAVGNSGSGGATSSGGSAAGGSGSDTSIGGTSSPGGTAPIELPDAAALPDAASDACVPGQLYQDLDGDHFGGLAVAEFGCDRDGVVTRPGDCFDAVPTGANFQAGDVHPGQGNYFIVSYPNDEKPDDRSFDYDCSGGEEPAPNNFPSGEARNCGLLGTGVGCDGAGFVPDDRRPNGPGVLSICGVESIITCTSNVLTCDAVPGVTEQLFACH